MNSNNGNTERGSAATTEQVDGQLDIFAQTPGKDDDPAARFAKYHEANPIVLESLIHEARRWMRERPDSPLGIALLIGRVRWVLTMKLREVGDGFRINDHFAPAYARLVMHYAPDTRGLFHLRRTQWADDYVADLAAREQGAA